VDRLSDEEAVERIATVERQPAELFAMLISRPSFDRQTAPATSLPSLAAF
jgi:hypothetical protein